jgi:hypothetical protein
MQHSSVNWPKRWSGKALRQAGQIIGAYLDPKDQTGPLVALHKLIKVLDTQELAGALDRMEKGFGLKVVK